MPGMGSDSLDSSLSPKGGLILKKYVCFGGPKERDKNVTGIEEGARIRN